MRWRHVMYLGFAGDEIERPERVDLNPGWPANVIAGRNDFWKVVHREGKLVILHSSRLRRIWIIEDLDG